MQQLQKPGLVDRDIECIHFQPTLSRKKRGMLAEKLALYEEPRDYGVWDVVRSPRRNRCQSWRPS
jgi:hypothetical protein